MSQRYSDAAGVRDRLVLGYHVISNVSVSARTVSTTALAQQVSMLLRCGYTPATFSAAVLDANGERRRMRDLATQAATEHGLEEVERLAREGNGAERQRAIHARGGMKSLLSELVRATSDF